MNQNIGLAEIFPFDVSGILVDFENIFGPSATWDSYFTRENWAESTNLGNQYLKSNSFREKYQDLLKAAGSHMGTGDFFYQAQPTFRIQLPGTQSVAYHTDDISSGHGKNIINFWLPLTNTNESNCLWVVREKESRKLLKDFISDCWSLTKLDGEARKLARAHVLEKNQILCFSNRTLHGTIKNESSNVRVSIDFRCLPIGGDPGTRILGVEYLRFLADSTESLQECTSVIYQSGEMAHIGHNAQRGVITGFATRNGFKIIRETSEWHNLNHYPTLMDIMEKDQHMPILLFSEKSFNLHSSAWSDLTKSLTAHKAPIYFCLENKKFAQ